MQKNRLVVAIAFMVVVLCASCGSTHPTIPVTDVAVSGGIAIGRIGAINQQLKEYSQQSRLELGKLTDGTKQLRDILSAVFDIAFGLCDQIDSASDQLRKVTENTE